MVEQQSVNLNMSASNAITNAAIKLEEIKRWYDRFIAGTSPRVQVNEWEPSVRHLGIVNPSVYENIATTMIPNIGDSVIEMTRQAMAIIKIMTEKGLVTPLSLKEITEEIRIISNAWKNVKFRDNKLSVLIEDVVLEDENEEVDLGHFWVHIDLTNPYNITIESVNEIQSLGGYYHPHIGDESLCQGKGEEAITNAICQGRLEDCFRVVESILRTYNDDSPYDKLEKWYEPDHEGEFCCENCREWCPDECGYYCAMCDCNYCENCAENGDACCVCDQWMCSECGTQCNECGEALCNNCASMCTECEKNYCSSCLSQCTICQEYFCNPCISACSCCNKPICEKCMITCGLCEENCCKECLDECHSCQKSICEDCQTTCEHCGVPMCSSCLEEHGCLLEGIGV
jgi:hypothetical protein